MSHSGLCYDLTIIAEIDCTNKYNAFRPLTVDGECKISPQALNLNETHLPSGIDLSDQKFRRFV